MTTKSNPEVAHNSKQPARSSPEQQTGTPTASQAAPQIPSPGTSSSTTLHDFQAIASEITWELSTKKHMFKIYQNRSFHARRAR